MLHVDDKSSTNDPSMPKSTGGILERYARAVNGQSEYVYEDATIFLLNSTKVIIT